MNILPQNVGLKEPSVSPRRWKTDQYNRRELKQFWEISKINCFAIDCDTAEYYSRVYYYLRKKGNPIATNDMWIAVTALQYNLALFSYDKHFRAVDGLITGNSIANFAIIPI